MALKVKATEQIIKVGKYADTYRYVMAPELYTTLNQNKVITEAALRSGISKGVMQAAWDAAGEVIKAWATEGHSVAIPGLGNMRFGLRAKSVADVNEVKAGLIRSRRIIFTPDVDLKNELADTAIQITCYDRNGNEVKRVTSDDEGTIEDNESLTPGPNTVANGDSLPVVGPEPHSGAPLKTPVAPVGEGGYVSISGVGDDGIQVDLEEDVATTGQTEDHEDENSGTIYTEGGTLIINNSTNATTVSGDVKSAKGMKALCIALNAGDITINMSGNASKAISCGDGVAFAYTTKGAPEEGFDCDNNSYIQITGTGIGISAGANQGGGGGGGRPGGGSSSSYTISNAKQGYAFITSTISYTTGNYYTLADKSGNNLVTYSFEKACSSSLALFTATGMVKGTTYYVKSSKAEPTDATTAWHGLYLDSSHTGTSSVTSFTAK